MWVGCWEAKLGAWNAEVSHIRCKVRPDMENPWLGITQGFVQERRWPFHGGTATRLVNVRRACRGRCDAIPGSAAHEWFGDPVLSGDRYPARAYRALPC